MRERLTLKRPTRRHLRVSNWKFVPPGGIPRRLLPSDPRPSSFPGRRGFLDAGGSPSRFVVINTLMPFATRLSSRSFSAARWARVASASRRLDFDSTLSPNDRERTSVFRSGRTSSKSRQDHPRSSQAVRRPTTVISDRIHGPGSARNSAAEATPFCWSVCS